MSNQLANLAIDTYLSPISLPTYLLYIELGSANLTEVHLLDSVHL